MPESRHHAYYDTAGNIIIPSEEHLKQLAEASESKQDQPIEHKIEAPEHRIERPKIAETVGSLWADIRSSIQRLVESTVEEGKQEYTWSIAAARKQCGAFVQSIPGMCRSVWAFLTQPVWIPGRHNEPVHYSRATLFFLDVVRFGGTFAMIFVALFVSLNYQSFWEIARAKLDPETLEEKQDELMASLKEKLQRSPSLAVAGSPRSDLLSFLPPVGPPENRIIIPKLNLNVPIVVPSFDALLREDWPKLETDIQAALEYGVVHYPGTAQPGQAGNFFVTGHSSYYPWASGHYKTVFARLSSLEPGDEYWVYYGGDRYRYIVRSTEEVSPSDVSVLDQPGNRRIGTLMTCTPVGTTLHRLVVIADEVDPETGLPLKVGEHQKPTSMPKMKMEMLPI